MTELEAHISTAIAKFKSKEYESCLKSLNDIEAIIGSNPKITHNKSVVEFHLSNLKSTEKFCTEMCRLTGQSYPTTDVNNFSPPYTPHFNYALVLYHSRYFQQSQVLLDKLLSVISQMKSPALNSNVVLLSMEVCLCRRLPERALEIGNTNKQYIEPKEEFLSLFDRLVARGNLMLGKPVKIPKSYNQLEWILLLAHSHYLKGALDATDATLGRYGSIQHNYNLQTEGEDVWTTLNNNLGVLYLARKKHDLAIKYFQSTLNERVVASRDRPLYLFNVGLALLRSGRLEGAFQCLLEATRLYPINPRLWLRLAQCCVLYIRNEDNMHQFLSDKDARESKLLDTSATSQESFAVPNLSFEFAALCLRNAISFLPSLDRPCPYQAAPSGPMDWKLVCALHNSVLLLSSYVSLQLRDPIKALKHSTALLSQGDHIYTSRIHRSLAHIYTAEALIFLGRASEAITHLNLAKVPEILPSSSTFIQDLFRLSIWSSTAVNNILRGEFDTAQTLVSQFTSPRMLPLQIYFEICRGKIDRCQYLIRKFSYLKYSRLEDQNKDIQVRFQN